MCSICRAIRCSSSSAYGTTAGTAFADFGGTNPGPCGVDVRQFRIFHSSIINSIRVLYDVEGSAVLRPAWGGTAGTPIVVDLEAGEKITGATGMTCVRSDAGNNRYLTQLVFFSEKQDGQKVVYGPYGTGSTNDQSCSLFAVNGKINSIFGREYNRNRPAGSFRGIGAIGFNFEDGSSTQ